MIWTSSYKTYNFSYNNSYRTWYKTLWRGVVVITTAQLPLTNPELKFCRCSNPAYDVSEICDGENLLEWSQLEVRLNTFRQSAIPQKQVIIIIIISIIIIIITVLTSCTSGCTSVILTKINPNQWCFSTERYAQRQTFENLWKMGVLEM